MIKFFRKIRYNLMSENKTSPNDSGGRAGKYFKYAIGEIILVVIGILIALQINNWNENRKDRLEEQELLAQLQSEFLSNLDQLDQKIALRNNMLKASAKLLNYIDYPESLETDSILNHVGYTVIAPTFDPIVNDIISSGRIQLLENSQLKEKLSRWTSELVQVTEEEQVWLNYRSNYYTPLLIEYGLYRNLINRYWKSNIIGAFHLDKGTQTEFDLGPSKKEINITEFINDSRFENHIAQCASFAKLTNSQALSLRQRIVEILNIIEQELNNN
ncbi:DUF6090 family protein [Hanstruepera ponticola]|uniref:DUF6090 family protein n=1 Tax=Hanstruepera ponticola TaxID=2042995 RepID=UPI00177B51C8|nr:DUF6090 family protein [Hanstruepera ponticola]